VLLSIIMKQIVCKDQFVEIGKRRTCYYFWKRKI